MKTIKSVDKKKEKMEASGGKNKEYYKREDMLLQRYQVGEEKILKYHGQNNKYQFMRIPDTR